MPRSAYADDDKKGAVQETYGQRIVLSGVVTPMFKRQLQRSAKQCLKKAQEDRRQAVLIIELHSGQSDFGLVLDVASFLTGFDKDQQVRSVAWIPKDQDVTGNNAIIALACNDIVMHANATLGDIGNGNRAGNVVRSFVTELVRLGHNPRLNLPIARAMMEPALIVEKVTIRKKSGGPAAVRFVTETELANLKKTGMIFEVAEPAIKEGDELGKFTGSKAAADQFLIVGTRETLDQVAAIYRVSPRQLRRRVGQGKEKKVALIRVSGVIDPMLESFLQRQIDRCLNDGKNLIIFEITSPGGLFQSSRILSNRIRDLNPERVKTIAYIPEQAQDRAALIALACDEIYMDPNAQIGNISVKADESENDQKNVRSELEATLRALAEKKHRSPAILLAMVNKDVVVNRAVHKDDPRNIKYKSDEEIGESKGEWQKVRRIPESKEGQLLTLKGNESLNYELIDGTVNGDTDAERLQNLKAHLGLPADMTLNPLERTWVDKLVFWLNTDYATVILLVVAIVCLYMEMHMTTGLLGILAALCFALFFWSRFLGGTAGWLEVVLFLIGLGCIALEIFVIPGFGVFGISGGLLVLGSLVLASQTFGNLEPDADLQMLSHTVGKLAISVVLVVIIAMTISRFLPHVPLFNQMVLMAPGHGDDPHAADPRLRPEDVDDAVLFVGSSGAAVSVLRPAGKAKIGVRLVDVVSDGPFIPAGSPVEVVSISGNRVVVRSTEKL